jgi:PST family polysaccharide transporter/lipopolysaccharide exporter
MLGPLREFLGRLKRSLMPTGSLQSRTVTSGFWLGSMNVVDRGLQMLMLVLLANLLEPRDFGLMGIALLSFSSLYKFSNLGINSALVQQEADDIDHYLDTAWVLEIARYTIIAIVLVLAAPLIADLFGEPRATRLLRVFALLPLLRGLKNPGVVYFRKDLEYHMQFVYRLSGSVTQFCVGVIWALVSPTVWALIGALIAAGFVRTVVSYLTHPYRPWPAFNTEYAREIVDYGKWITGSSILGFLTTEGDDVVVGTLVGATALGFYQLAYRLSNAPATEISEVIAGVMFPTFSKLQNDMDALRRAYLRMVQVTAFISFPAAFGIALVTPSFVRAFLGTQWLPMVTTMQLLALYGLLRSIGKTFSPAWKALGRPDYVTKLSLVRVVLLAITIVPMTHYFGIEGTALVVVGVSVVPMMPLDVYIMVRSIDISYQEFVSEVAYPMAASILMAGAVLAVENSLVVAPVLEFVVLVLTGVLVYLGAVVLLVNAFDWGIEQTLRSMVNSVQS